MDSFELKSRQRSHRDGKRKSRHGVRSNVSINARDGDSETRMLIRKQCHDAALSRKGGTDGMTGTNPPSEIDPASWVMIQKPRRQDRKEENVTTYSHGPHSPPDRASSDLNRRLQKEQKKSASQKVCDNDFALAWYLQEEEALAMPMENPSSKEDVLRSLDKCQRDALCAVEVQAKARHNAALPDVRLRVSALGYKSEDLDRCLVYIRDEAPIIIHLNEQCLSFLARPEETHYRNLFEVNYSGGISSLRDRELWERKMFGRHYDGSTAFQRVKYGCLNLTGDIEGVAAARCYGPFHILLKDSVRHRCTFFNMDTSAFGNTCNWNNGSQDTLATARYYCHILQKYSDDELHSILALSRICGGRSKCQHYKEVQVHGPICLVTDIEALSIPGHRQNASKELMSMVERFQEKTNCTILWQADLLGCGYEGGADSSSTGEHISMPGGAGPGSSGLGALATVGPSSGSSTMPLGGHSSDVRGGLYPGTTGYSRRGATSLGGPSSCVHGGLFPGTTGYSGSGWGIAGRNYDPTGAMSTGSHLSGGGGGFPGGSYRGGGGGGGGYSIGSGYGAGGFGGGF